MKKLIGAINKFNKANILVIGDLMVDEYLFGDVNRISPEAPVPVINVKKVDYRAGGAANLASNITSLGGKCTLIGQVGNDNEKDMLLKLLATHNIIPNLIEREDYLTIKKTRAMANGQQLLRIDWEVCNPLPGKLINGIIKFSKQNNFDMIIVSDYNKGMITQRLMKELKNNQMKVVVDPTPAHTNWFKKVFVVTPNLKEAKEMCGADNIKQIGKKLLRKLNSNVIVTRGPEGLSIFDKHTKKHTHIPTKAKKVYDVSGAGDTFVAGLVLALVSGLSLEESAILANHAAGIVVGKLGTATVTAEELKKDIGGGHEQEKRRKRE